MIDLKSYLKGNSYPGRGIILGKTLTCTVMAYFIMGRSENSRNRVFAATIDGIRTKAFDESKLEDPSLIIYSPVRAIDGTYIVTNGDQTDTVYDFLKSGDSFENALLTREFEPDMPNYTPRISGVVYPNGEFELSILKSDNGDAKQCVRNFYKYNTPIAGQGKFIHTYKCDGNPIPSFEGEPVTVEIPNNINDFTNIIWDNLNSENKVSLFVRYMDNATGEVTEKIINKHI